MAAHEDGRATAGPVTAPEARAAAAEGWIYGLPLVDNYRVLYAQAVDPADPQYAGGFGVFFHDPLPRPCHPAVRLPRHEPPGQPDRPDRPTPAPAPDAAETDTRYSWAWLDLRAEPWVLSVPEADRYYVLPFHDLDTCYVGFVGSRTTGPRAGNYLIAGPGWDGVLPVGIDGVLRADSFLVGVIGRVALHSQPDTEADVAAEGPFEPDATFDVLPAADETDSTDLPTGQEPDSPAPVRPAAPEVSERWTEPIPVDRPQTDFPFTPVRPPAAKPASAAIPPSAPPTSTAPDPAQQPPASPAASSSASTDRSSASPPVTPPDSAHSSPTPLPAASSASSTPADQPSFAPLPTPASAALGDLSEAEVLDLLRLDRLRRHFLFRPLSEFAGRPEPAPPTEPVWPVWRDEALDTADFFRFLDFLLPFFPAPPEDAPLRARLARLGIGAGSFDPAALSPEVTDALTAGLADARAALDRAEQTITASTALYGTRAQVGREYALRALAAERGLYALPSEEAWYREQAAVAVAEVAAATRAAVDEEIDS